MTMKKVYLQPNTEIVNVSSIQMMAASLLSGGKASESDVFEQGDEGDVKTDKDWDIWE